MSSHFLSRKSTIGYFLSPRRHHDYGVLKVVLVRMASIARALTFSSRYLPHQRRLLERLKSMKDLYIGRSCLVIAGGPSADELESERVQSLQSEGKLLVLTLNNFVYSDLGAQINPDFVVFSDPAHHPLSGGNSALVDTLHAYPHVRVVIPSFWRLPLDSPEEHTARVFWFEDRAIETWGNGISPVRLRRYISMTALKTMAIAHFLGFERIGILGLDATEHFGLTVDSSNRLLKNPFHQSGVAPNTADVSEVVPARFRAGMMADWYFNLATFHLHLAKMFSPTGRFTNLSSSSQVTALPRMAQETFLDTC
jgi:hypothetical protein